MIDGEGNVERRDMDSDLDDSLAQGSRLREGSKIRETYGPITKRYRHRYEFNNAYEMTLTDAGLNISGKRWTALWWRQSNYGITRGSPSVPSGVHPNTARRASIV